MVSEKGSKKECKKLAVSIADIDRNKIRGKCYIPSETKLERKLGESKLYFSATDLQFTSHYYP